MKTYGIIGGGLAGITLAKELLAQVRPGDELFPSQHLPTLAQKALLSERDFEGESFISLARDDPYRAQIDAVFARAGVQRRLSLETASAVAVCAMVQQGLGLAIVNPLTARACAGPQLVVRPLAFSIAFQVHMLLPLHRPADAALPWLTAALEQEALGLLGHRR